MTVEIRELVIRAVVIPRAADAEETEPASRHMLPDEAPATRPATAPIDQDAIVQACVEQVMRILRKQKER